MRMTQVSFQISHSSDLPPLVENKEGARREGKHVRSEFWSEIGQINRGGQHQAECDGWRHLIFIVYSHRSIQSVVGFYIPRRRAAHAVKSERSDQRAKRAKQTRRENRGDRLTSGRFTTVQRSIHPPSNPAATAATATLAPP